MYLYDDWFPSVILEVLCHGRVAGRVEFTVLNVTPRLQLQRQAGHKHRQVRAQFHGAYLKHIYTLRIKLILYV